MKLEAWGKTHNSHGFYINDLIWCPEGEGPDKKNDWVEGFKMIRMPQFDTEINEDDLYD